MNSVSMKTVEEELPKIKTDGVTINAEHQLWRELFVRLPADVTWSVLNEQPTCWRAVQKNVHCSLRVHDRVWLMAHDESELGFGIVCTATGEKVQLAGFKKHSFKGRDSTAEWADDKYRVLWSGSGWVIERKSDGVRMKPGSYSTIELAKAQVRTLYPIKMESNR